MHPRTCYHDPYMDHFHHFKKYTLGPFLNSSSHPAPGKHWSASASSHNRLYLPFLEHPINRIKSYALLGLAPLPQHHVLPWGSLSCCLCWGFCFFYCWIVFQCMDLLTHFTFHGHRVVSSSGKLWVKLLWIFFIKSCCEQMLSFLFGKCLGEALLHLLW